MLDGTQNRDSSRLRISYAPIFGLNKNTLWGVELSLKFHKPDVGYVAFPSVGKMKGGVASYIAINRLLSDSIEQDLLRTRLPNLQVLCPVYGIENRRVVKELENSSRRLSCVSSLGLHHHAPGLESTPGMEQVLKRRCHAGFKHLGKMAGARISQHAGDKNATVVSLPARPMFHALSQGLVDEIRALIKAGLRIVIREVNDAWMLRPLHVLAVDGLTGDVLGAPRSAAEIGQLMKMEESSFPARRPPRASARRQPEALMPGQDLA